MILFTKTASVTDVFEFFPHRDLCVIIIKLILLLILITSQVGKQTPIAVRFSTVGGESGSADTARCQKRQTDDCWSWKWEGKTKDVILPTNWCSQNHPYHIHHHHWRGERLCRHCQVPEHLISWHLGEWCQELRYSLKREKEKNASRKHLIFRHLGISCQNLLGGLGKKIKHYVSPINWFFAKSPSPSAYALNTKKLLNHMLHKNC